MDIDGLLRESRAVELEEMLAARERRANRQEELLAGRDATLISFTLNMPGAFKNYPLAKRAFATGSGLIESHLERAGFAVTHREERTDEATGCEGFFRVDGPAARVKAIGMGIEDGHPLGRLFDIDVLDSSGRTLRGGDAGRPERECLICGRPVWECARNRTHTAEVLARRVVMLLADYFDGEYADWVASQATRALLYEVNATPKPGLVDRRNNGAHRDMNIRTFIDSSVVLTPYFRNMTRQGMAFAGDACTLLPHLRYPGQWAEDRMFAATGGVNTHKGLIFSFGIVSAGLGLLRGRGMEATADSLSRVCAEIAAGMPGELAAGTREARATHGEKAYARFAVTGIRGEAANGYPHVRLCGYPVLKSLVEERGCSLNDAGVVALLHLLVRVEDTNVVARSDFDTLRAIQAEVGSFLRGDPDPAACLAFAAELDRRFIGRNISPGGCADLLALSYLFYFILA